MSLLRTRWTQLARKPAFALQSKASLTVAAKRSMSGVHRPHYHEKQPEGKNYMQLNFESDGVWTTTIRGEEVVVPDLQNTLEFTLPSPCGEHTFEESPIVKETKRKDEETETDDD